MAGKVAEAQKLLGRYYQIRGVVTPGHNRGRKASWISQRQILSCMMNCAQKPESMLSQLEFGNKQYKGVANIGYSPTFDDQTFSVEVHILDFNENIYDRKIRVNFIQRIRDEKKFSNISELSDQIKKDIVKARKILS